MSKKKRHQVVYVEWIDSGYKGGWNLHETRPQVLSIRTVGYLLEEDKRQIVISSSVHLEESHSPMAIPKVAITKLERRR